MFPRPKFGSPIAVVHIPKCGTGNRLCKAHLLKTGLHVNSKGTRPAIHVEVSQIVNPVRHHMDASRVNDSETWNGRRDFPPAGGMEAGLR